jgi:ribulose-phosphate 3-epimerase
LILSAGPVWIGPSILSSDLLKLGEQITIAEHAGVDFIHFDVMDGRFVPNITFGLPVARAVRAATRLPLDVHLMIVEPEKYVREFVDAGADTVTIQVEAAVHAHRTLSDIHEMGATPGIALNPGTPLSSVTELIPFIGNLLIMTVDPGFGGQTFIPAMLDKVRRARELIDDRNPGCRLEIDGGIKASNIGRVVTAGADTFVAGSSIFDGTDLIAENVVALRRAASVLAGSERADSPNNG